MSALRRWLGAAGRFWWDFLVGDTPELFVATLVLLGAAVGLRHDPMAAVVVLPVLAVLALVVSAWRGAQGSGSSPPADEPARNGETPTPLNVTQRVGNSPGPGPSGTRHRGRSR